MQNLIHNISISNFKSIKECNIHDCKQINLFIGRPNVGKSNILEALSLFTTPYLIESSNKNLSNLLRIESEIECFHNGNNEMPATISTGTSSCKVYFNVKEGLKIDLEFGEEKFSYKVDEKLSVTGLRKINGFEPFIKKYDFTTNTKFKKSHSKYLIPPRGANLLSIIENYPSLKSQVLSLFHENNLEVVFDKGSQSIKIIQRTGNDVFLIPYNSIADTLQRLIFYKAAIISNTESVLLFEEPEAHSFPPYMSHVTQEMIYNKGNQYFLSTHSPFILNDLLENAFENLSVFIIYYENAQTKIKKLSEEELHSILQDGIDIFTNSESFA
jgi:AAA15 family ATPase/GTPase